ncbi:MAG: hypothetical protein MMC23_003132 [Stictis urceolatum]|nr:hypothetical protein [Stictis urceolata]
MALNVVVACCIFFERLFWVQEEAGDNGKPLTAEGFRRIADEFRRSEVRVFCSEFILSALDNVKISRANIHVIAHTIAETAKTGGKIGANPTVKKRRAITKAKLKKWDIGYRVIEGWEGN